MGKSVFEGERGGIVHRYELREHELHYSAGRGDYRKENLLPWSEFRRFENEAGTLYLTRANGHSFGIWVDPRDMEEFLKSALVCWARHDRGTALKASFDYGNESKTLGWIWLGISAAFPGMFALILLTDGYHERHCNTLFAREAVVAEATVNKIKKNRRGSFIWTMDFVTSKGIKLTGTREAAFHDEAGKPLGDNSAVTTVVYAPTDLSCWDLSTKPGQPTVNQRNRHFVVFMDLTFGWMFAIVAGLGAVFGISRIRRQRPWREAVLASGRAIF